MSSWIRQLLGSSARRRTARRFIPEILSLEERVTPSITADGPINSNGDNTDTVKVATSANNNSVAVYTRQVATGNRDVFAQRIDANGDNVGSEIDVGTSVNDDFAPDVALDDNGNFVVVWTHNFAGSGDLNVLFKVFDSVGNQTASSAVSNSSGFDESNPCVAMSAIGNWVVAFETSAIEGQDIYVRRFSLAGTQQGPTIPISASTLLPDQAPAIDCTDGGAFAVTYVRGTAPTSNLLLKRFNAAGGLLGSPTTIAANTFRYEVAIKNGGTTTVVYTPSTGATNTIFGKTIDVNGVVAPRLTLFTAAVGLVDAPAIGMNRVTGKFVLAATDGVNIVVRKTKPNGTLATPQHTISNAKTRRLPAAAMNKTGKYFIGFIHEASANDHDAYGADGQLV